MRRAAWGAVLLVLAVAAQACAQGRTTVPAEIRVAPGRLAAVTLDGDGKATAYEVLGDLDCFREYTDEPGKIRLRLIGYKAGTYWLVIASATDKAPALAKCRVIVGAEPPPVPPDPPAPGPEPTDPLYLSLKAAWAKEADPKRGAHRDALAALYRQAAASTVNDTSLKTLAELFGVLRKASAALVPADALPAVRRAAGDALNADLGTNPAAPLDAALRQRAGAAFARLAAALEALK